MTNAGTRGFRIALMVAIVGISYLAFTPLQHEAVASMWDKGNHGIAFILLALLLDNSWPPVGAHRIPKVAMLIGYGAFIECVQAFIPDRQFSLRDLVADGVGILLYYLAMGVITTILTARKKTDCSGQNDGCA